MDYDVKITKKDAIRMLEKLKNRMPTIHKIVIEKVCMAIVSRSQKHYLTGGSPLNVRTGLLRRKMNYDIKNPFRAEVGNNTIYAKVHESENISDRTIVPKRASRLYIPLHPGAKRYQKGMKFGKDFVLAKKVVMPHRPFIKPAIDDTMKQGVIGKIIGATLNQEFKKLEASV